MPKKPPQPPTAPTTAADSSPSVAGEPATARGEQTKRLIVDVAMRLFRENGYDKTTMRAIAREAGVSVGNAYYYFASKEHLIEAFYEDMQIAHQELARPVLATSKDFGDRLRGTMRAGVEALAPYHEFAGHFFKNAADPASPLHPLSAESTPARAASMALFAEVFDGSTIKADPELRAELPELIWLAYLGVILFWVHDASPGQEKTFHLIDQAAPMIDRLVGLSRLRVLRPISRDLLELIATLKA